MKHMESVSWQSAHYEEPFATRRRLKIRRKLVDLGVSSLDPTLRILDTCCGNGDALAQLAEAGFRHLTGIDGLRHPSWSKLPFPMVTGDVTELPFEDKSFDAIINLHALHHLGGSEGVGSFLRECRRVLKPGGRLFILDFPSSLQIRLLFWGLRCRVLTVTPELSNFARILDEEWSYLAPYLVEWPAVRQRLFGSELGVEHFRQDFFLYYLCLAKR